MLANTLKITVPVGHVLVGDAGCYIEHDDTALALDIVAITETTKLLLSCGIPHVEEDGTEVGEELERVNLNTESGWKPEAKGEAHASTLTFWTHRNIAIECKGTYRCTSSRTLLSNGAMNGATRC